MARVETDVSAILKETTTREAKWKIRRFGKVDEIEMVKGTIRFRVTVWDEGRAPFIVQWFNDIVPANDFLDRLQDQATE